MRQALILFQLSLWVSTVYAFYPFVPEYRIAEGRNGAKQRASRSATALDSKTVQTNGFITFPISRRAPADSDESLINRISRIADGLAMKYGSQTQSKTPQEEDTNFSRRDNDFEVVEAEEPTGENSAGILQDGTDFSYFLEVKFGAEEKPLYMLLDTGASTTWVMGHDCESDACTKHDSFGPDDSSTFKDTGSSFSIMYGTGEVSGNLVTDSMSVAGITTTLDFGLANVTSSEFSRFPFEGILGLSTSSDSFFSALKEAGSLDANVIGISLARASDGVNNGEISFGALDQGKYEGDITYASLVSDNSWAIPLDDVTVDGNPVGITGKTAYLDTGTTYAFAPEDQVKTLFDSVPGASSEDGRTYTVPCDSEVPVAFTFGGASWSISSADLLSDPSDDGVCTANIFGMEVVKGNWLLGDVFLKNVYSVFDMDQSRIGKLLIGCNETRSDG
ncbi:putative aspartic-type endopeptidase protein [Eutypa lata UCREL1]|uniref:Putative aspartic-type endopeptidase protein n=1 Tax=Eutypa lata (strain UCR-EL1) TaxID=1287681 RepID=M7SJJ9_EUTLA|nr:putative aspartic-type endopeptidase protein [Eutypa lata UCREL1]